MPKPKDITFDKSYAPTGHNASLPRNKDVMARQNVLQQAIEAGRKNEPRTDDPEFDATQLALVGESQGFVEAAARTVRIEISTRTDEARGELPTPLNTDLEQAVVKREVAEASSRYGSDLDIASSGRSQAAGELRAFEEEHGLAAYSAIYGDSKFLFVTWLILMILTEGVGNAFLFRELQDSGLLGGAVLAGGVSVANILLGFGTGFLGLRLMVHSRRPLRLLGIVITAILMTAAFALHLALGDLREAISRAGGDASAATIDFLVFIKPWRWLDYSGIPPFLLVAVGLVAYAIAAFKSRGGAHGICSVYWGHDTRDRRFRAAEAQWQDARENLKDALQNAYGGERAKLRERHAADQARVAGIRALRAEAQRIARTLGDSIADDIGRLHYWLRQYRDRNRAVRTTPAPAYFDVYPAFDEWRTVRLDTSEIEALVAEAEQILAENQAKLATLEQATLVDEVALLEQMLAIEEGSEKRGRSQLTKDRDIHASLRDARPAS